MSHPVTTMRVIPPALRAGAVRDFCARFTFTGSFDCWLWASVTCVNNPARYGKLLIDGQWVKAHRVSWMLRHGEIPDGLHVLHRCDVPRCVNPNHLFLGTGLDNIRDKIAKGRARGPQGEAHARARLTERDVRAIYASSEPRKLLAARYGVSRQQVAKIKARRTWKHLDLGPMEAS